MGVWQMWCSVCQCGFSSCCTYIYDWKQTQAKFKLKWLKEAVVIKNNRIYYAEYDDYGRFGTVWDSQEDNTGKVIHRKCWEKILLFLPDNSKIDLTVISQYFCKPSTGLQDWEISTQQHDDVVKRFSIDYRKLLFRPKRKSALTNLLAKPLSCDPNKAFPFRHEIVAIIFSFLNELDSSRVAPCCKLFNSLSHMKTEQGAKQALYKAFPEMRALSQNLLIDKLVTKEKTKFTWKLMFLNFRLNREKIETCLQSDSYFIGFADSYCNSREEEELREQEYKYENGNEAPDPEFEGYQDEDPEEESESDQESSFEKDLFSEAEEEIMGEKPIKKSKLK